MTTMTIHFNNCTEADFEEDFMDRIHKATTKLKSDHTIEIIETGQVIAIDEDNNIKSLGCPYCVGLQLTQDEYGQPTIGGKKLLLAKEYKGDLNNLTEVMKANLWLCPYCFMPMTSLMPTFC